MLTEINTFGMFPRAVDLKLRAWMDAKSRKPLILRGARQVGKTVSVKLFARNFDHFINMNMDLPYVFMQELLICILPVHRPASPTIC